MTQQEQLCYRKNKHITDFILLYRSLPCLWKVKSKEYHNRELRTNAYNELIKKLKEIDPSADRTSVVKKINSLRSNLRKEQRKVADLAKQGVLYEPRLWYYSLFDFLNGQERSSHGGSPSHDNDSEEESAESNVKLERIQYNDKYDGDAYDDDGDPLDSFEKSFQDESSRDIPSPLPKRAKIIQTEFAKASSSKVFPERTSTILHYDDKPSFNHEDQYDVFGKNVAAKLRDIASKDNTQRLMAEKIINDALFIAELGKLEMAHCSKLQAE